MAGPVYKLWMYKFKQAWYQLMLSGWGVRSGNGALVNGVHGGHGVLG